MDRHCVGPRSSRGALLLVVILWSAGGVPAAARLFAQQPAPASPTAAPVVADTRTPLTAFVNVAVIPMDRERVLRHQTVVVRDRQIVALGPADQVAVPAGAARVDGRGKFLLPGLGDMHVHGGQHDIPMLSYPANGVTTVRDMHSGGDSPDGVVMLARKRRLAAGDLLGPHLYLAGDLEELPVNEVEVTVEGLERANFDIAKVAPAVETLKAAGFDFVKSTPHDLPRPLYDSITAAANRVGLRVVGHVPGEGVGLRAVLHDRWASIEHLMGYFEEIVGLGGKMSRRLLSSSQRRADVDTAAWMQPGFRPDEERLRQLAVATRRAGVWNCPTVSVLLANLQTAEKYDSTRYPVERRLWEFTFPVVKALQDAGAGLLLGTDAMGSYRANFSAHRELALLVQMGLTPYQALATGTRNVAAFLGTLDSTGTVAVGKRADLVLLEANPLEDIRHSRTIAGVMLSGRWLPRAELDARLEALRREEARRREEALKQEALKQETPP